MFSGKIVAFLTTDYIEYNHSAVTSTWTGRAWQDGTLDMDCMQLMDITTATTCFLHVFGCTAKPHQIGKGSRNMCGANHGTSWKHLKFGKVSSLKACNFCNVCDGFVRNSISHHPPVVQHRGLLKMLAWMPNNGTILDWNSSFDPDFTLKVGMSKKTETTFEVFLKKDSNHETCDTPSII